MAALGDGSPLTAQGKLSAGPTATYTLPLLGLFVVESVVAQIDNSGGGDTQPELRVRDKSGAVIATKRQGEAIPAGDTGSATWALRLDDDGGSAPDVGDVRFNDPNDELGARYLAVPTNDRGPSGLGLFFDGTKGAKIRDTGLIDLYIDATESELALANGDCFLRSQVKLSLESTTDLILLADGGHVKVRPFAQAKAFQVFDHAGAIMFQLVSGATAPFDLLGVFGAAPVAKQAVAGSRGGNAALASLLTALANYGLITDNTTP